MTSAKNAKPGMLITYLCTRCRWDFARSEKDEPACTMCSKSDRLKELKREPMSQQALEIAMMRSMERLMTGLQGAYDAQQKQAEGASSTRDEKKNDEEEILLLEAMVKAKNLQKHVEKAFGKGKAKKKRAVSKE